MYEPKFGHVIGMSQKIAPKIDAPWVKNVYISSNLGEEHGCIPLSRSAYTPENERLEPKITQLPIEEEHLLSKFQASMIFG